MIFRSRKQRGGGAAVAEMPRAADADPRPLDEVFEEVHEIEAANRAQPDREHERKLVRLRHRAGARMVEGAGEKPEMAPSADDELPDRPKGSLPEIAAADLTPGLLRAGMLRDGCLLVRGVVGREDALRMADDIDRAFEERAKLWDGGSVDDPNYEEFQQEPPYRMDEREWVRDGGGVLAADCPRTMFDLMDIYERAGLRSVVTGYLGERAAMSVNKSTLRRARPTDGGAWHQDGAFMGDVRALNVWLSLSHCGDVAPGLDVVPHRLDETVPTGTEGAIFDWSVSPQVAAEAAGPEGFVRPIFEPGDVMLFDELCLHSTALDPSMTETRYAVESWFFGPSAFPADYTPLAF